MIQEQFIEMVELALEHWDFESADEPYKSSKRGLELLATHPLSNEQLAETEETHGPLTDDKGNFDWDWLQELAVGCAN